MVCSLHANGDYYMGEIIAQKPLLISQHLHGDLHEVTRQSHLLLSAVQWDLRDFVGSTKISRQLVNYDSAAIEKSNPLRFVAMVSLAVLLDLQDRFDEAESTWNEAFTDCSEALGPMHPVTLTVMSEMAHHYAATNRHAEAYAMAIKATELYGKAYKIERNGNICDRKYLSMDYMVDIFYDLDCLEESEKLCIQ